MVGYADGFAILVDDLDFGYRLASLFVDGDYLVVAGDRVTEIDRAGEADVVVAVGGDGTFVVVGLVHERGCGARKREGQHTMRDARAILRALHVLLIGVERTEIACYSSELVHVRFGDGLRERLFVANLQRYFDGHDIPLIPCAHCSARAGVGLAAANGNRELVALLEGTRGARVGPLLANDLAARFWAGDSLSRFASRGVIELLSRRSL